MSERSKKRKRHSIESAVGGTSLGQESEDGRPLPEDYPTGGQKWDPTDYPGTQDTYVPALEKQNAKREERMLAQMRSQVIPVLFNDDSPNGREEQAWTAVETPVRSIPSPLPVDTGSDSTAVEEHLRHKSETPAENHHSMDLNDVLMERHLRSALEKQLSLLEDWSGRGAHVDYSQDDTVPLSRVRWLGRGLNGDVYETSCKGVAVAWKTIHCRYGIGPEERKEIEVLKKLKHDHIIKLVGTYIYRQFLGLLLWPVATCDLATLLEDLEAMHHHEYLEGKSAKKRTIVERMTALGFEDTVTAGRSLSAQSRLWQIFGCLAHAIQYLHGQCIRHKDLKPSNVLLSSDGLWLTDFGTSTDFSLLSTSKTNNGERGTPKYFAPEVAAYESSGRSADIFSLGCIFLEVFCVYLDGGCLETLRLLRPAKDRSFQANLPNVDKWFDHLYPFLKARTSLNHLAGIIRRMLKYDQSLRPTASELVASILETSRLDGTSDYHGPCCKSVYQHVEDQHVKDPFLAELSSPPLPSRSLDVLARMRAEDLQAQHILEPLNPSKLDFCRALYNFTPDQTVEGVDLAVKKGDLVAVLRKTDPFGNPSEWWRCRTRDGRMGYLPSPYLEIIQRRKR